MIAEKNELQRKAENLLCRNNRKRWIENHFYIKDKKGSLRVIGALKEPQLKLLKLLEWCKLNSLPRRVIVLKARKTGISTFVEADMTCEMFDGGIDGIVIAHDDKTARYIFEMTMRYIRNYDLPKPSFKRSSKRELQVEGEGMILVETANNVQAGTGVTPQYIHCSEVAKWQKGTDTATALFQSIAGGPETAVVLESTAFGYDGLFHPYWENSSKFCDIVWDGLEPTITIVDEEQWNGYLPLFIAWFEDEEILEEPASLFSSAEDRERFEQTLDEYERNLQNRFYVSPAALKWRRWAIREKCQNDVKRFKQEYPSTPSEAFITTGRPRFDHEVLDMMPVEKGTRGELFRDDNWLSPAIKFKQSTASPLKVFRHPIPRHRYVVGVDTAEGKMKEGSNDPDATVATVLDMDNYGEQVATLSGQISEEVLVDPLLLLGFYYNTAFIVPERVSYGQHVVIRLSREYPLEMVYKHHRFSRGRLVNTRDPGFRTNYSEKNAIISDLAEALSDGSVIVHDAQTLSELKAFSWTDSGKLRAQRGYHDDHVIALALGIRGMLHFPNRTRALDLSKPSAMTAIYHEKAGGYSAPTPHGDGY